MRTILLCILSLSFTNLFAQDILILNNKTEINGKVTEITDDAVKYKKATNPDGPNYTVKKADVFMIRYKNGTKETFDDSANETSAEKESSREAKTTVQNTSTTPILLKNKDDAARQLQSTLSIMGIEITGVDDKKIYRPTEKGKPGTTLEGISRTLTGKLGNAEMEYQIVSDAGGKLLYTDLGYFNFGGNKEEELQAYLAKLGFGKASVVAENGADKILWGNGYVVHVNGINMTGTHGESNLYHAIYAYATQKKSDATAKTSALDDSGFNRYMNGTYADGVMRLNMQQAGYNYLFSRYTLPQYNFPGEQIRYSGYKFSSYFSNGVVIIYSLDLLNQVKTIEIEASNPIDINTIKNVLAIESWKKEMPGETEYYQTGAIKCYLYDKSITLNLVFPDDKSADQLKAAIAPDFNTISGLYTGYSPNNFLALAQHLYLNYLPGINVNFISRTITPDPNSFNKFCFKTPSDSIARILIDLEGLLNTKDDVAIVIDCNDQAYMDAIEAEYKSQFSAIYKLNKYVDASQGIKNRYQFSPYSVINQNEQIKHEQEMARKRQEAEAAARKAEKQKRTAEAIDAFNQGLLKITEQMKQNPRKN